MRYDQPMSQFVLSGVPQPAGRVRPTLFLRLPMAFGQCRWITLRTFPTINPGATA
jgi:hypothetical protein